MYIGGPYWMVRGRVSLRIKVARGAREHCSPCPFYVLLRIIFIYFFPRSDVKVLQHHKRSGAIASEEPEDGTHLTISTPKSFPHCSATSCVSFV